MSIEINVTTLDNPNTTTWSSHASEIALVFDTSIGPNMLGALGTGFTSEDVSYDPTPADEDLSRAMNTYWANFAKTHDPNGEGRGAGAGADADAEWEANTGNAYPNSLAMVLESPAVNMQRGPKSADCAFWCSPEIGSYWCLDLEGAEVERGGARKPTRTREFTGI